MVHLKGSGKMQVVNEDPILARRDRLRSQVRAFQVSLTVMALIQVSWALVVLEIPIAIPVLAIWAVLLVQSLGMLKD